MRAKATASYVLGFALVVAGAGCNRDRNSVTAQNNPPSAADRSGTADRVGSPVSDADRTFIMNAAQGGMTEVQLGKLAQEKGVSQAVKDFGKTLETDHNAANEKLKSIATDLGVTVPAALDSKHQSDVDKLAKLSGAKFDREFMSHAVKDHKDDISEFQKEAENGSNDRVKSFATDTLPTLHRHLEIAENHKR